MEYSFNTLTRGVIIGIDLGLAVVRVLLEHVWLGGLVLGLCLLIYLLKLPAMLLLSLILFLMGGLMLFMTVS